MSPAVETERKVLGHPSSSPTANWLISDSVTSRALAVLQACSSSSSDEEGDERLAMVRHSLRLNGLSQSGRLSKTSRSQESQNHTESGTCTISNNVRGNLKDDRNNETGGADDNFSQRTEPQLLTEGEREILHHNTNSSNDDFGSNYFTQRKEINPQRPSPTSTTCSMARQSTVLANRTEFLAPFILNQRSRVGSKNQASVSHSSRFMSAASSRSPDKSPSKLAQSSERAVDSPQKIMTENSFTSSMSMQRISERDDVEDVCPHDLGSEYGDILSCFLSTPFDSRAMKSLYQSKEFKRDADTKMRYKSALKVMSQRKFLNTKKDMLADELENQLLGQIESLITVNVSSNINK